MTREWMALWLVLLAGCGGGAMQVDAGPDASSDGGEDGGAGAIARFQPSDEAAMAFGDVPFPHDLYLGPDGRVALSELPSPGRSGALTALLAAVRRQTGFSVLGSTHFLIDGALDPASVPAAATDAAAPVVMVDVDPASPERGMIVPLELQWLEAGSRLSARPALGRSLHRSRRYAVALTSALRAANGTQLAASGPFLEVRDGAGTGSPGVARARAVIDPVWAELAAAGVERSRVVSLAVFTTHDPTVLPRALREVVRAAPAPVASVDVVYPSAARTLDDLLGVPSEPARFGLDVPEAGGVSGEIGIRHDSVGRLVIGSFTGARVITGSGTDVGDPVLDASGGPMVTGPERIPFLLIVPAGADVTSLPVVIVAHGSPRTMEDGLVLADTFGGAGIAVLAFDAYQHGGRSPSAVDLRSPTRRAVPDGISEHDNLTVSARLQGVQGVPAGTEAAVTHFQGAWAQAIADALSAVRLAVEGDVSAIAAADSALAGLAFDPNAVFYLGQSFGTFAGGVVLGVEPDVSAVLLNVPSGSVVETIVGGARSRATVDALLTPFFGIRGAVDDVERRLLLEPNLDLFGWVLEGTDCRAMARYVYREPVATGARPDVLYQIAELDDFLPVWAAQSMMADLGVERIGPFDFVPGVTEATRPVSGNVTTPSGAVTAVARVYEGASHRMIGYRDEQVAFAEPIMPPLMPLDPPRLVTNPINELHLEMRAFFATRVTGGRARVE